MAKHHPPPPNEFELSLFGPGYGECAILHIGENEWIIVDSCLNGSRDRAVALEYFDMLGIDVREHVKLILVTHWHDDHIGGAAQLLRNCSAAKFACSGALDCDEFLQLVAFGKSVKLVEHKSGLSEFSQIIDELNNRNQVSTSSGPDHWACEGQLLYARKSMPTVEVYARSPSAQTITDTKGSISRLLPHAGQSIRPFHSTDPNERSVVVLIITEGIRVLLGADLEVGSDESRGWHAVISSAEKHAAKAHVYKVAHHGSPNADCTEIWTELLEQDPMAIVTPYARGSQPRPSAADVRRLKERSKRVYCTTWPIVRSPPRRHKTVERTMKEVARNRRAFPRVPGQIRLRVPMSGNIKSPIVELFDGARML